MTLLQVLEDSWIRTVFTTTGAVGLVGLILQFQFEIQFHPYMPMASMMIAGGIYGLIIMLIQYSSRSVERHDWGNHPISNGCFGIGLLSTGGVLLVQNSVSLPGFALLATGALLFVVGIVLEEYVVSPVKE